MSLPSSDSYVIRTTSNRNKWADPLQCTLKNQPRSSNLAFLWRSTFIPWQRKVDKMILVYNRVLFYQTSLNFCNLGFNYQCLEKGVWGFLFCLELDLFAKVKKNWFLHSCFFTFLLITRDLNKIKKPKHPFVDIVKYKTYVKFYQKILNFMVVEDK